MEYDAEGDALKSLSTLFRSPGKKPEPAKAEEKKPKAEPFPSFLKPLLEEPAEEGPVPPTHRRVSFLARVKRKPDRGAQSPSGGQ